MRDTRCRLLVLFGLNLCACTRAFQPTKPLTAKLFVGMGVVHHRISTRSAEAQKYFDQGLALVYAFNFGEAVSSFQRAAELDTNSGMPYWGIALAQGPNYNAPRLTLARERSAFDAIQTAVGLSSGALESERAYILALARAFTDGAEADQHQLARDYANAMREVYRKQPDDPDASALFAVSLMDVNPWQLWTQDRQPGPDTIEIVSVLEQGLRRWPEHTGLNHFYLHAMEASPYPERALPSAFRLETLAPQAGHLVHMPSHIYIRTGDYAAAVKSNQRAMLADDAYQRQRPAPPPSALGYSFHNLHYLAVSACMDGEFQVAYHAANQLITRTNSEHMTVMPLLVLARFGRWKELIIQREPPGERKGLRFFWHLLRACAFASLGQPTIAENERAKMEEEFEDLPEGPAFGVFFNDWSVLRDLADASIDARIAVARGNPDAGIRLWRTAISIEDKLNFDDTPDWYYPVRESLGATLLKTGRAIDAEQVFREDLQRNPRNPRSLFGLSLALEAEKRLGDAALVRTSFVAAWKGKELPRIEDY